MRAAVILNGSISDYAYIKSKILADDYIICADGGYNHAKKMGISPNIIIGDMDSGGEDAKTECIKYPVRKDYTDGELAVEYAVKQGFREIIILGAMGDRADHSLTDVFLLTLCENGCIIDENNEIYLLRDAVEVSGRRGDIVSVVPVNGDLYGVTTQGLEYPLKDETLYFGKSRGVSNVMTEDKCKITAKSGMGLIIKINNKPE